MINLFVTPVSPPLDALSSAQTRTVNGNVSSDGGGVTEDGKSEDRTRRLKRLEMIRDKTRFYKVTDLIEEHREFERDLEVARKRRADLEREITDLRRKAYGQNLDLDANFLRKKELLANQEKACRELSDGLKLISEQLEKRFDYRVIPANQTTRNSLQKRPRAKMSTAAPSMPRAELDTNEDKKIMFNFRDGNLWCKECDLHYPNLKQYCDHLHKRDHLTRTIKPAQPPWRTNLERIPLKKSYDLYKSICAKLSNKLRTNFTVQDLDEILNPSPKDPDFLKTLSLDRERGNFSNGDPLFSIKGYDLFIPINGYFCKLCNVAVCDFHDAEQHLKSFQHVSEHAKSVALNPDYEKKFRLNMNKSLTKQKNLIEKDRHESHSSAAYPIPSTSRDSTDELYAQRASAKDPNDSSQWSARLPYKKPTSHIVDDHDVVADKFYKRDRPTDRVASKATKPPSPKKTKRRLVPEIVPIGLKQPSAALKRLRNDRFVDDINYNNDEGDNTDDNENQTRILEAINQLDSSPEPSIPALGDGITNNKNVKPNTAIFKSKEEIVDLTEGVHLLPDDPDSPFPGLDLVVTGNMHCKILTDERLAQPTTVVLNRINLDDYKDMLLEGSSLWARVDQMITKREPGLYNKDLDSLTHAEPTYFQLNGDTVPVELDKSSDEDEFKMEHLENFFCES